MVAFVVVLLVSNTVAVKVMRLGPFTLGPLTLGPWDTDGATLLFPISYIFGDVLTEVYGYARSRRVIWLGFAANIFVAAVYALVGWLPAGAGWPGQEAYAAILGQVPRIVLASLVAFLCGEFCNSYVLARLKVLSRGRWLWTRTLGSTVVGQAVDTTLFVLIAFWGVLAPSGLLGLILFGYVFKVLYETLATPVTYAAVNFLSSGPNGRITTTRPPISTPSSSPPRSGAICRSPGREGEESSIVRHRPGSRRTPCAGVRATGAPPGPQSWGSGSGRRPGLPREAPALPGPVPPRIGGPGGRSPHRGDTYSRTPVS